METGAVLFILTLQICSSLASELSFHDFIYSCETADK